MATKLEETIEKYVLEALEEHQDIFPVDIKAVPGKKVVILLDGDKGVKVAECAHVSRYVGNKIEEENLIANAYNLEVSSPGVDFPLKQKRQYPQHTGRDLAVKMTGGATKEGKLITVNEESIVIEEKIKEKGKKAILQETEIPFADITEAKVVLKF